MIPRPFRIAGSTAVVLIAIGARANWATEETSGPNIRQKVVIAGGGAGQGYEYVDEFQAPP